MMRNQLRIRAWMVMLCLLCVTVCIGCGQMATAPEGNLVGQTEESAVEKSDAPQEEQQTGSETGQMVYCEQSIPVIEEIQGDIDSFAVLDDIVYLYTVDNEYGSSQETYVSRRQENMYAFRADGTNFRTIYSNDGISENAWLCNFVVERTGQIDCLYGDNKLEEEQTIYYIQVLSEDGTLKDWLDLTAELEPGDTYFSNLVVDEQRQRYYLSGENYLYAFDRLGNKLFTIHTNDWITDLFMTAQGELLCGVSPSLGLCVQVVDLEQQKFGEILDLELDENEPNYFFASGDHLFCYQNQRGIYGYDRETGITQIVDGADSTLSLATYGQIAALPDNQFLVNSYEYLGDGAHEFFFILGQVDSSEIAQRQTITFGGAYIDEAIKIKAQKFNQSQNQYRVSIKDYSLEDDPFHMLKDDLAAGKFPDIIDLSGLVVGPYIAKGYLADLYPMIQADPDMKKGDFLESAWKVLETDGKLHHISTSMSLSGMVGRVEDLNEIVLFEPQDLASLEESHGQAKSFYMTTNQGVMHFFCNAEYENFVDWTGRACHFDTQEFIDLLEYAQEYPSEEEIDWTTQLEAESQCELIQQRKLLFMSVDGLEMLRLPQYEELFDGEVQFVGTPCDVSQGMGIMFSTDYGIAENSSCKEGAWAFLRTLLTEEAMTENPSNAYYGQLPTRKDALESVFKWYFTKVPYTDAYGREVYPMDEYAWGLDDTEVHVRPLEQYQIQNMRSIVEHADHSYFYDSDIIDIIIEETQPFFAGQTSAKETAERVQKRATEYMNEMLR